VEKKNRAKPEPSIEVALGQVTYEGDGLPAIKRSLEGLAEVLSVLSQELQNERGGRTCDGAAEVLELHAERIGALLEFLERARHAEHVRSIAAA